MKRFPTILATWLNKARKRPVALLACVALLVGAADLALMAAHRFHQTAHAPRLGEAIQLFHLDGASASAADHPFSAEATRSSQPVGWIDFPLRWFRFTLPFGPQESGRTDLR
jgi:hypothetical protein